MQRLIAVQVGQIIFDRFILFVFYQTQVIEISLEPLLHVVQLGQQATEAGFLARLGGFTVVLQDQIGTRLQPCRHLGIVVQRQLGLRFQLAQSGERRQFVKAFQVEVIEKALGGGEHRRAPRHVTMTDHANPLALLQCLDDLAVDRNAANVLDLATGQTIAWMSTGRWLADRLAEGGAR